MKDYGRIPTSPEVWAVIRARHHADLHVFSSYSAPNGDQFGDPSKGVMFTAWGFADADYPIMEAETTWDIDADKPHNRLNEKHKYWLCLPKKDEEG